jgi:oxygen-independent coproporphyrinogen-3 oxidase
MNALPPLSLYVHLPWCPSKCPYCDFNSYAAKGLLPERPYVEALLRDLDEAASDETRPIESVFIGGGTPSLFSGESIHKLLDGIRARLKLLPATEITLEANPGAVEAARFAEFRDAGINRLSIGIQSFRDRQLELLGRVHNGDDARRAVDVARSAGFDNFNLDLMYGLPEDEPAAALADVEMAISLAPTHVSWYQLTLEPNTAFHRSPPPLPEESTVLEIEAVGRAALAASGYQRYEVSAYARPGRQCRHNLNYWRFGDYIGIGAGAHGKLTNAAGGIERIAKTRNPRTYMQLAGSAASFAVEQVNGADALSLEFLMNALRLPAGVSRNLYTQRTGLPLETIREPIAEAVTRGWLVPDPQRLVPTLAGLESLNAMLRLFP